MEATCILVRVNGKDMSLPASITIGGLLERQGLLGQRIAVEVNGQIVPRSLHVRHALEPGDQVEIVHAIGGG